MDFLSHIVSASMQHNHVVEQNSHNKLCYEKTTSMHSYITFFITSLQTGTSNKLYL